ncbi:hypothetical protein V6N11_028218 [Hibiscus sabdariffa]|uniref:Uncharacterized protein n=2 Tax=Hibiscus sabdariffa TaxID=183260 RepID=A0ABR2B7U6_9ROSI
MGFLWPSQESTPTIVQRAMTAIFRWWWRTKSATDSGGRWRYKRRLGFEFERELKVLFVGGINEWWRLKGFTPFVIIEPGNPVYVLSPKMTHFICQEWSIAHAQAQLRRGVGSLI